MTKVLVIEDEKPLRDEIVDILGFEDYDVVVAEHGRAGVKLAQEHLPDLIVCDITMPELDGYGVLSELRLESSTAIIPFMFLTARADKSFVRHGMELGADDYLTKPFTRGELLEAIRARLGRSTIIAQSYDDHLEEAKAALTRMVTHELRTPLISLRTTKDILERKLNESNPLALKDLLDSMEAGIERLTHVVEQTIYLTHLETGLLRRDAILEDGLSIQIDAILRSAIETGRKFAYRHRRGTIQMHLAKPQSLVKAHAQALKYAFAELISNALIFSKDDDEVKIEQSVNEQTIHIQIIDLGVGLNPAQQAKALEKFTQINRANQEQQGMGLGLHVAQRIIEAHGGVLKIISGSGKGTQICVSLPVQGTIR